jgi:hypothetical protein
MDIERGKGRDKKVQAGDPARPGGEALEGGAAKREGAVDLPAPSPEPSPAEVFLTGIPQEMVKALGQGDRVVAGYGPSYRVIPSDQWPKLPVVETDPERFRFRPVVQSADHDRPGAWWSAAEEARRSGGPGFERNSGFARVMAAISSYDCGCEVSREDAKAFLESAQKLPDWIQDGVPAIQIDFGEIPAEAKERLADYRALVLLGATPAGYARATAEGGVEYVDCSRAPLAAFHPVNLKKVCEILQELGYQDGATPYVSPHRPSVIVVPDGGIHFDQAAGEVIYRGKDGRVLEQVDLVASPWARLMSAPSAWKERAAAIVVADLIAQVEGVDPLDFEEDVLDSDPRQEYRIKCGWVGEGDAGMGHIKPLYVMRVESSEGWSYTSCGAVSPLHVDMTTEGLQRAVVEHLGAVDTRMCSEDDLLVFGIDDHYELRDLATPAVKDRWETREGQLSFTVQEEFKALWNVEVED